MTEQEGFLIKKLPKKNGIKDGTLENPKSAINVIRRLENEFE